MIKDLLTEFLEIGLGGASNYALNKTVDGIKMFTEKVGFLEGVKWDYIRPFGSLTYWEDIYSALGKANTQLGISGNLAKELNVVAIQSLAGVAAVGGDINDISDAYGKFIDNYGRSTLFDKDAMTDMVKLQKAFGEDFSEMLVTTKLTGKSIKSTYDFIGKASKKASKQGVLISKVIKSINKNIGMLDDMNFVSGIKGLERMAIMSEKTMINMETAEKLADNLQDIDGAIEFSTNAQMLGGEFARLFGNASRLAYEARNAPDELMKRVTEVAKGMAHIGSDGSIQISSLNRQMFKELDKISNGAINSTELVRAARLSFQEDLVREALLQQGINDATDDMVTKLTSLSELDSNGDISFDFGTDGLKSASEVAQEISKSGSQLLSRLDAVKQSTNDPIKDMIQQNMSIGEKMATMMNTFITKIANPELYNELNASTEMIVSETNKVVDGVDGVSNSIVNFFQQLQGNGMDELRVRYQDMFGDILNFDSGGVEKMIDKAKTITDGIHAFDSGLVGFFKSMQTDFFGTFKKILFTFVKTLGSSFLWLIDLAIRRGINLIGEAFGNTMIGRGMKSVDKNPNFNPFEDIANMANEFVEKGSEVSPDGVSFIQSMNDSVNKLADAMDDKTASEKQTSQDTKKLNEEHKKNNPPENYLNSVQHLMETTPTSDGKFNNTMEHVGGFTVNIVLQSDVPIDEMSSKQKKDFTKNLWDAVNIKMGTQIGDKSTIPENKMMQEVN